MFSSEIRSFARRKSSRRFGAETIHDGRFTTDDGRFAFRAVVAYPVVVVVVVVRSRIHSSRSMMFD
jgi:hypothetical protein